MRPGTDVPLLSAPVGRIRRYAIRVAELTPPETSSVSRVRRAGRALEGVLVLGLLDLNRRVMRRRGSRQSGWWETDAFPWISHLEAEWPAIRSEVQRYLTSHAAPRTMDLIGAAADPDEFNAAVPSGDGVWRTIILQSFGRPVASYAPHFPRTMDAVARIPARANVGFSCLDPHSCIDEHTDPNFGSLRLQLPIIVPGRPGDCRLQVGEEAVSLEEGRAVIFDLTAPHSACNESDGIRVLLTTEILMPAPVMPSCINRATQRAYGRLPSYRGLVERANALAAAAQHDNESATDGVARSAGAVSASTEGTRE